MMMSRRLVLALMLFCSAFTTSIQSDESIEFSVNVVIHDQEVTSIGRASYNSPSLCLECRHWGNHRINGASKSVSWSAIARDLYEQRISDWIRDAGML